MPLTPGATLGPYAIVAPIGAGGMGEVYRARDPRLHRDVAIKVLRADGPRDEETRARFEREARSVAALNHPHIGAVYDVGADNGTDYIVMELVEGETLAARLASGRLSLADALRYAGQVAAALDAAHRAGIVHRDLKPGNIMLTRTGAKLLDFGLATPAARGAAGAVSATTATDLSMPGAVVGTWPYMAPEQILGQRVDARTDIFAFGVVLYEMLTGRRPFAGDSAPQVIAAILERNAEPLSTAAPDVPRALRRLVEKCLAKPAEARWQSMTDVADALHWIEEDVARPEETATPAARAHTSRRSLLWLLLPVTAALGVVAGAWLAPAGRPFPPPVVRFAIAPADLDTSGQASPEISPDGRQLLFVARPRAGGPTGLYLHDLATASARRLEGTDGATFCFWSPDGRSVGFVAGGRLLRTDIAGGSPRSIMDVQDVFLGAAWGRGDVIVVSQRFGFYKVPAGGGTPTQITSLDGTRQENSHRWPQFFPDGQRFVFVARSGRPDRSSAYVGFVDGRPPMRLMETTAQVRYSGSGHLLYVQDTTLMARALNASTLALEGDAIPIADGIQAAGTGLRARFSLSESGVLVHQAMAEPRFQLRWHDRSGQPAGVLIADALNNFRISPDASRVVLDLVDTTRGGRSVWLVDAPAGNRTRVTFGESDDWQPIWSRDGTHILFGSYRDGPLDLHERPADGSAPASVVLASEVQKDPADWAVDGRTVLVNENTAERASDVVAYDTGTGSRTVIAGTTAVEYRGRFSPDDRFIAYASDESGRFQVYVQPFPPTGAKWQITTDGGNEPRWREDGRELYYLDPTMGLMVIQVETSPTFRYSRPALLFKPRGVVSGGGATAYDPTPDGKRFLIRERAEEPDPGVPMQVILNWPSLVAPVQLR